MRSETSGKIIPYNFPKYTSLLRPNEDNPYLPLRRVPSMQSWPFLHPPRPWGTGPVSTHSLPAPAPETARAAPWGEEHPLPTNQQQTNILNIYKKNTIIVTLAKKSLTFKSIYTSRLTPSHAHIKPHLRDNFVFD